MRLRVEPNHEGVPWRGNLGNMQMAAGGEMTKRKARCEVCVVVGGRRRVQWWVRRGGAAAVHSSPGLDFRCIWMTHCWLCSCFRGKLHEIPFSCSLEWGWMCDLIPGSEGKGLAVGGSWMSLVHIITVERAKGRLMGDSAAGIVQASWVNLKLLLAQLQQRNLNILEALRLTARRTQSPAPLRGGRAMLGS